MQSLMSEKIFSEFEVRVIMEQLLLVLDFFQKKHIVHRDLKPNNILIKSIKDEGKNYEIKVADLGLSVRTLSNEMLTKKCGTPGYIAPEIFNPQGFKVSGYSYKADIFSAATVFFNLLTGFYIFFGDNYDEILQLNMKCDTEKVIPYI